MNAKLIVGCLVAGLSFGAVGCKGEPPTPPKSFGEVDVAENKAEIKIEAFEIATPDFVDQNKQAMRPADGEGEVAIVRLQITNKSDKVVKYKPAHFEPASQGVQLSTDPNPDNGDRIPVKSVTFDSSRRIHTTNQLIADTDIKPNGSIHDDYLFEIPNVSDEQLVVLIPGSIVGDMRTFRFYVNNPPRKTTPPSPASLNQPVTIDGLEVKVTKVAKEYAPLAQRKTGKPLTYQYAYTKEPILVLHTSITNNSQQAYSYEPSHTSEAAGIILELPGGNALKRIKLVSDVIGEGQVNGKITINPGETKEDVFFFEAPSSSSDLNFSISGHIFGVRGMYRYGFKYNEPSVLREPDLEPWKRAGKPETENGENADDAAPADDAAADAAPADDAAADAAPADDAAAE